MLPRHLNYFIAVAEHGGFTRAAAILHVSQPALSQQIRQLEETLGVRLFDRSGRNTCLTDAGKVWLIYARRALRELAEGQRALHDVDDLQRGTLRVAMMPTFTHYFIGPAGGFLLSTLPEYNAGYTRAGAGSNGDSAAQ